MINALLVEFVILDEVHKCKNITAGRTKAVRLLTVKKILGLSGTPVMNRPAELWSFLNILAPDVFNNYEGFVKRYADGKNGVKNEVELKQLLSKYMIRRKKSEVQKDLPPIIRTTQFATMNAEQKKQYDKLLQDILIDLKTGDEIGMINNILTRILRLKQFLSYVKMPWVAEFAEEKYDEAEPDEKYKKVIIFSQFTEIVNDIARQLNKNEKCALRIIGAEHSPHERQSIVDDFQTDDRYRYLVCSIKAVSEGLNITAAGHVIFADFEWNDAIHTQAEGRAYGRLGDAHSIESHYFAVEGTLDDWLQSILLEKLRTTELTIEGVSQQRKDDDSIIKALFQHLRGMKK
jgi:SNF2 family DNA or RNA helicase